MQGLIQLWRGLARGTKVAIGLALGLTLLAILFPPSCSDSKKSAPAPAANGSSLYTPPNPDAVRKMESDMGLPSPAAPPAPAAAQISTIPPSIAIDHFTMSGTGSADGNFGKVKEASAAPDSQPIATPAGPMFDPGAVVVVRPSPEKPGMMPADSVGSFVYDGGDLHAEAVAQKGVQYKEMASLELQGWMPVKEAGRYQFQFAGDADASFGAWAATCTMVPTIEGKALPTAAAPIATNIGQKTFTLLSGADLQPGVYKVSFWVGCVDNLYAKGKTLTLSPYIKGPSDANFRLLQAADIAHKKS